MRREKQRDELLRELVSAVDELGNALFGPPSDGKSWRDAKAEWWQRIRHAVEQAEHMDEAERVKRYGVPHANDD
jgi:uncharacterized protein HemX